jgi:hypothetical protein
MIFERTSNTEPPDPNQLPNSQHGSFAFSASRLCLADSPSTWAFDYPCAVNPESFWLSVGSWSIIADGLSFHGHSCGLVLGCTFPGFGVCQCKSCAPADCDISAFSLCAIAHSGTRSGVSAGPSRAFSLCALADVGLRASALAVLNRTISLHAPAKQACGRVL